MTRRNAGRAERQQGRALRALRAASPVASGASARDEYRGARAESLRQPQSGRV